MDRSACAPHPQTAPPHALLAIHTRWANEPDPIAATTPARAAFLDRFEREVDPDGQLDPKERARRAEHAKKAYFAKLALASSRARAAKKGGADVP